MISYKIVMVAPLRHLSGHPFRTSQLTEAPVPLSSCFPLFPNDDPNHCSKVCIYGIHVSFHFAHGIIVNPSSDDPVKTLDSVRKRDAPISDTQLFQLPLELLYGILMRTACPLILLCIKPESKSKILELAGFRNL